MDDLLFVETEFPALRALGSLFTSYGIVGLFSGRMDRWIAYGYLAAGCFFSGLLSTINESWAMAALGAGMAAFYSNGWWHGGGDRQVATLLRDLRDGGAR
ncbi:hypothetical protein [Streptomyces sp. t39]|uniref:hypothetical protein n=1 Tax=Streptomyces sp. t39 TaxID=1828156 RepID=UPI0011CDA5D6|nr:hypothetical protein [Streptomyces sp. t39]TXS50164.1 hypothetical protein EAO77_28045 [Streptomyces sp. t39]